MFPPIVCASTDRFTPARSKSPAWVLADTVLTSATWMSPSRVCNRTLAPRGTSSSMSPSKEHEPVRLGVVSAIITVISLAGSESREPAGRRNSISGASFERARTSFRSQPWTLMSPDAMQRERATLGLAATTRSITGPVAFLACLSGCADATTANPIGVPINATINNGKVKVLEYFIVA